MNDMVGVDAKKKELSAFLNEFPKVRAAILMGPPGVGKTTMVHAVATDLNYDIIEMNASDARNSDQIKKKVQESTRTRSITDFMGVTKGKIILIDEVDGISGNEDRGGIQTLIDIIEKTEYPIVMTCNEWLSKLKSIYNVSVMIKFTAVRKESIARVLTSIVENESIKDRVSDDIINMISENARGDFRSAINDLESYASTLQRGKGTARDGIPLEIDATTLSGPTRDEFITIYEGIGRILSGKVIADNRDAIGKIDMPNVTSAFQWDTILDYIIENFVNLSRNPKVLGEAADLLAMADAYLGYLKQTQDWSILAYFIDFLAASIARLNIQAKNKEYKAKINAPKFRFGKDTSPG
nr:AAA family ATPase [Candidatus Sigynarchaeota archaeon]